MPRRALKCHTPVVDYRAMAHDRSPMRAIAERSVKQLGLVTTEQLSGLGVHVWRLPGHPATWHQRLLAASLEAGPDAVVSHVAACALWRFEGIAPGAVEVTVPRSQRPRRVARSSTAHAISWR